MTRSSRLPRTARFDEQGLGTDLLEPRPDDLGGHLRPIVRTNVLRDATLEHDVGEGRDLTAFSVPGDLRDFPWTEGAGDGETYIHA